MVKGLAKSKKIKDSDSDGLSDFDEINYFGSDPYNADSDGDGIEDGEAVLNGKDPVGGKRLKDFFIPHEGNDYQPHALHPKRLLFHALSILAIKSVIIILVFFYPLTAWMTPDVSAIEGKKIIDLTNKLRKSLSLDSLKQSSKLDQAALKKVEDMLINQYFAHQSPKGFDLEYFLRLASYKSYITVGENLAIGYDNASEVMDAWKNSPTHYSNLIDPNFTEIGVALAGGPYLNEDTIFSAQYFALPQINISPVVTKVEINKKNNKTVFKPNEKAVLAKNIIATPVSTNPKVIVNKAAGVKDEKIVKVEASLPLETQTASLEFLNNKIEMTPLNSLAIAGQTQWVGQAVINDNNKSFTPPVITLTTESGEVQKIEVSESNIKPQKTSIASQYWLFKNHPNEGLKQIFDISSIYFKIILGFVLLASILNIFIKIRKQNPKLILSSLSLIAFLVLMIIF